MLINKDTSKALDMFLFILSYSFLLAIALIEGINTILMLPITDIGTNSIGKVIPDRKSVV